MESVAPSPEAVNTEPVRVFEIINPSDPYTIEGSLAVCRAAVLFLGGGAYGLKDAKTGEDCIPIFVFGGYDEWCKREGFDLDAVAKARQPELVKCLRSCWIGSADERLGLELKLARMDPEKRMLFLAVRQERMCSSMNDIGARAFALADRIDANAKQVLS